MPPSLMVISVTGNPQPSPVRPRSFHTFITHRQGSVGAIPAPARTTKRGMSRVLRVVVDAGLEPATPGM